VWHAATGGYGVDAAVMSGAAATERGAERASDGFDRKIIDGLVGGVAWLAQRIGREFTALQSGEGQLYAALVGAGAVLLVSLALWLGR
jgi:hypothetical protein